MVAKKEIPTDTTKVNQVEKETPTDAALIYRNEALRFEVTLPEEMRGYTVTQENFTGTGLWGEGTVRVTFHIPNKANYPLGTLIAFPQLKLTPEIKKDICEGADPCSNEPPRWESAQYAFFVRTFGVYGGPCQLSDGPTDGPPYDDAAYCAAVKAFRDLPATHFRAL